MLHDQNDPLQLPDDLFSYENDKFFDFVHRFAGDIEAEILQIQRIKNARLLLLVPDVFSFLELECEALVNLKQRACFLTTDKRVVVKPGIKFNVELFIELVRRKSLSSGINKSSLFSSNTSTTSLSDPLEAGRGSPIIFNAQRSDSSPKTFVYTFIDNLVKNLNRSKNHYEYNLPVQKFASALHILAGTNTYEYLRINLPGSLPAITTLEGYNRTIDRPLKECEFRFEAMKEYLRLIDSRYIFAVSEYNDAT